MNFGAFCFNRCPPIPRAIAKRVQSGSGCSFSITAWTKWRHQQWRPWFSLDFRVHRAVRFCSLPDLKVKFNSTNQPYHCSGHRTKSGTPRVLEGFAVLLNWVTRVFNCASLRKQPTFGDATTGFPAKWRLWNERRNSILMTHHYPDLGSASDWSCRVGNLIQPIRNTTQIWVVTRHQYGISALVSQTSFGGETSGSVAKCRLFSQASVFLGKKILHVPAIEFFFVWKAFFVLS